MIENAPIYMIIFLLAMAFCSFANVPFDKEILIAIINGFFILIAAAYSANTLARRKQMKDYAKEKVSQEDKVREAYDKIYSTCMAWNSVIKQSDEDSKKDLMSEELEDKRGIAMADLVETYNAELLRYKTLLTEIRLYCDSEFECPYKYVNFVSWETGRVFFAEETVDGVRYQSK